MPSNNEISQEDKDLFRKTVGKISPVKSNNRSNPKTTNEPKLKSTPPFDIPNKPQNTHNVVASSSSGPNIKKSLDYRPFSELRVAKLEDTFNYTITSETKLSFYRSSLTKNQNSAFKRGKLPIAGTLDLHGLTADEAKVALLRFIDSHYRKRHKMLLVIHGKGRHHGPAKLKNLVNYWLPQCPEVLAFVSAETKDGGTGALYLLLKG